MLPTWMERPRPRTPSGRPGPCTRALPQVTPILGKGQNVAGADPWLLKVASPSPHIPVRQRAAIPSCTSGRGHSGYSSAHLPARPGQWAL